MNKKKQRLDVLLTENGLAPSRNIASAMILAGEVMINGQRADKPGQQVSLDAEITLKDRPRYVSRGGDKLASVAEELGLDFRGKVVLDVGSSTGGFTDYALENGASKVYCIDVGSAQLAYRLRQNPQVVVMERIDIRDVTLRDSDDDAPLPRHLFEPEPQSRRPELVSGSSNSSGSGFRIKSGMTEEVYLPEQPDIAVIDVSFISLTKILDSVSRLIKPDGRIVAMMKPQFEAGKEIADAHKGLILDEAVRQDVILIFRDWASQDFHILAEADSGVAGKHGNRERFFILRKK